MRHGEDLSKLNPELKAVIDKEDLVAKYQIEVQYGQNRTLAGPNVAVVSFYIKGSRLGGGGDEKLYLCEACDATSATQPADKFRDIKQRSPHVQGCGAFIPPSAIKRDVACCPGCQRLINAAMLTGEVLYKAPTSLLAQRLADYWRRLEGDADLYIKYHTSDIRFQEMVVRLGSAKARRLRGLLAYPLARILRDTASGKSIETAFADCLSA